MPSSTNPLQRGLSTFGSAIRLIILFMIVLSLPLSAAQALDLSDGETTSWILALYGLPGLLALALALRYRQPLLMTGNIFVIIFIVSLGGEISYPELAGATALAGAGVLLVSALGLMGWLAAWIPAPIVFGLLSGAIMPFIADIFTSMGDSPVIVGGTFLTYILGRWILKNRLPAILPALVVGIALSGLMGQLGAVPERLILHMPVITVPVFSLNAIASATPVLIVLITLQSNLPSVIFLQSHDYQPPERVIDFISGAGTLLGSLLGPTGISLSLPATSLVAGEAAGEHRFRHRAVYVVAGAALMTGILAGIAAEIPALLPSSLLFTLAGLAVVDVLTSALKRITQGPLTLGPMFAFAIALSDISLLSLGSFFWALVFGMGISLTLEREALQELRMELQPHSNP